MKKGIHPDYRTATVSCSCGNTFQTKTTTGDLKVEICSKCHPFFTGTQKLIDSAGRVEKYYKRYKKTEEMNLEATKTTEQEKEAVETVETEKETIETVETEKEEGK
ncbi:50S ribosomal protein L31 [bacterium]|nr:50S ribosomal protein L31 [bacterium]